MQAWIVVVGLTVIAFIVSVPCGYLRENYAKFSFMWFFLIHIPIPFIVLLRLKAGLGWHVIPLTLGGTIAGQIVGGRLSRRRKRNAETE